MRIGADRRLFLQTLAAGLLVGPASGWGSGGRMLAERKRWATGNATLNPPAFADGRIYFCGDMTFGSIAPGGDIPLWVKTYVNGKPAAFRPRTAKRHMICGGRHWIGAFDRETGEQAWRHDAAIQTGVPLVTAETTFFGDGHEIIAVETRTGAMKWRFAGVPDTLASYAPMMSGDTLLAGPGDGRLYALSAVDGSLRWQIDGRSEWQYLRQLHVDGGTLVAGSYKEKLFGIAIEDGTRLWSFNAGNFINSHHVAAGVAYLWSPTGFVYAIDTQSGAVRWRHQTTDYDHSSGNWASLMAELVTHTDGLYALDMDNVLHVLNLTDGSERARARVPGRVRHAVMPLDQSGLAFPLVGGDLMVTEGI